MNLHGAAQSLIQAVNPFVLGTVKVSLGPGPTAPDGSRQPTYRVWSCVPMQVQALTFRDIQQLDGLNLQGVRHAIYLTGHVDGLVRAHNKGGDLIYLPKSPPIITDDAGTGVLLSDNGEVLTADAGQTGLLGSIWLVAIVLEHWPDWTKCAVTLQDGS